MIDRKFKFVAVNPCNNKVYTEENAVVFCAKDLAFLTGALPAYEERCRQLGCGFEHIESIRLLRERVAKFQADNPDLVKLPDTDTDCEIARCIGGKV